MANQNAKIDDNHHKTLLGVTDDGNSEIRNLLVDNATGRLKVSAVVTAQLGYDTIYEEGVALTQRNDLNFVGSGITAADDAGNSWTEITLDDFLNDIADLVDPNADRILFWDDSAGAITWLTAGAGLTITGTTISSTASAGYTDVQEDGSAVAQQDTLNFIDAFVVTNDGAGLRTNIELDPQLVSLAGGSATGYLVRSAANTITNRTITAASSKVTIVNGDGVAGNTTIDVDAGNINFSDLSGTIDVNTQLSGPVPLALGGTAANLVDPGADRILFWDDSAGAVDWLTAGSNLTITGTTLNASGGSGGATTVAVNQVAHGFVVGDVIRMTAVANTYAKAQADSAANAEVVGIVTEVSDADNFTYTVVGEVTVGVPSGSAGDVFFLSPSTAGAMTATPPTSVGQVIKALGVLSESATSLIFKNYVGQIIPSASSSTSGMLKLDPTALSNTAIDYSYTVPGGTLGTTRAIKVTLFVSSMSVSDGDDFTLNLNYGATTVVSMVIPSTNNFFGAGTITAYLFPNSATNAQKGFMQVTAGEQSFTGATGGTGDSIAIGTMAKAGTSSEDSTVAKDIQVELPTINGTVVVNVSAAMFELI